jgi:TIR domain
MSLVGLARSRLYQTRRMTRKRTQVFISYSHRDAEWLERLRIHLRPLMRDSTIEVWDDTQIQPGALWRDEIRTALANAKVAILLISADFLASDFIASEELPPLLEAAKEEGAIVLPLIVSPSRFSRTVSLSKYQAVNDHLKPLVSMTRGEQEEVLNSVAERVESAIGAQELRAKLDSVQGRQERLEFLIRHFVTGPELYFLKGFASENERFEFQASFRDEEHLRRLRDTDFIENLSPRAIADLKRGDNLKQFFRITEKGSLYLRYVLELEC